jgi:starch-binding outer membrane protein, SusD/RagB family
MKSYIIKLLLFSVVFGFVSCKKYLDKKSDMALSTPDTLEDLQALLDNEYIISGVGAAQTGADDYFVPLSTWQMGPQVLQQTYIWEPQLDNESDWTTQYQTVLIANTVLDRVDAMPAGQKANSIKGSALFLRAHCFYQLAQLYAPQYDASTASNDLGIVLRLEPDFLIASKRASVKETYDQILSDLQEAQNLLPNVTVVTTRPNKAACFALLARTYLQISDYQKARDAAQQSLSLYSTLIDYNNAAEVDPNSNDPFLINGILNKEILFFHCDQSSFKMFPASYVDSVLYHLYDSNDLRKTVFFAQDNINMFRFKGSYAPQRLFAGLSTPEVYLIKAEAEARLGNVSLALQSLTTLLQKRYVTGTLLPLSASTADQALQIVLTERKKEMAFRGMRWADLRRLNKIPGTAITIRRNLNGIMYTLPPNDLRYTLLIPTSVIHLTNMPQNPR